MNKALIAMLVLFAMVPLRNYGQDTNRSGLARRIESGDGDAMLEAGKSNDQSFVPLLKSKLSGPNRALARNALAKLGDSKSQRQAWCEYNADWGYMKYFEYIGGWFGVRGLDLFLARKGEGRWYKLLAKERKDKHNDALTNMVRCPPHLEALDRLGRLLPTSPAAVSKQESSDVCRDGDAKAMHAWIWQHKDELSKLEPTGNRVDFSSKSCKNEPGN